MVGFIIDILQKVFDGGVQWVWWHFFCSPWWEHAWFLLLLLCLLLNLFVGEGDCCCCWTWRWLRQTVHLMMLGLGYEKRKNGTHPNNPKRWFVWAEFLRISQLSSKQKHTCQHHYQWLGLFLAAWLFCYGLTDQHSTLLPVGDLMAYEGVWCFDLSGLLPLALVWNGLAFIWILNWLLCLA